MKRTLNQLEFQIEEYETIFSTNFDKEDERNTLMYIHRSLRDRFTQIELPGLQVRDCVLIEISMNRKEKVLVGCIYSHGDNSDKENEDLFCILRNLAHR